MPTNPVLPDDVFEQVTRLSERGNREFEQENYREASAEYQQALALIPGPVEDWEAATWMLTAVGDCFFMLGDFQRAHQCFERGLRCADIDGSEFLILRAGQARLEVGDIDGARAALADAWRLGGAELFEGEDRKYLDFLRSRS